ncbi:MAG: hypothetical protein BECKG1743E_GA0114224_108142, partial [Candidatus Kentron sp. G]
MCECWGANTWVRPYAPPNVGANLVFTHYARFALMPKSCGSTALYYYPAISCFFYGVISIRYWFAIDIAIRYRYRSYPAFSIASSDIDSDPERTTTPVAPWPRYVIRIPPI